MTSRCDATIAFGDDHGDNSTIFHCQLPAGHDGEHQEDSHMGYDNYRLPYTLRWQGSSRELAALEALDWAWFEWACEHGDWFFPSSLPDQRWCGYCGHEEQMEASDETT